MRPPFDAVMRAAGIGLVGGVTGAAANLVVAVLVGRSAGTDGAGRFFTAVAIFLILANVLELGADTALVRFVAAALALDRPGQVRALLRVGIVPVGVVGLGVVAATWALAGLLPGPGRAWWTTLAAAALGLALLAVVLGALRSLRGAGAVTVVQTSGLPVLRLTFLGVGVAAGLVSGPSDWATAVLLWAAPVGVALAVAVVLVLRSLRALPPTVPGDVVDGVAFWRFSGARGVAAALEICLEWADVLVVGVLCSPAQAGIYAVVTRAARSAELVQHATRIALGPALAGALARRDHDLAVDLHHRTAGVTAVVTWPFFTVAAWFAPGLLSIFGDGFADGAAALRVLCVGMALAYAAGGVQTLLLMSGLGRDQVVIKLACLVVNVTGNLALVPVLGIVGAAIAWSSTLVLDALLARWRVQAELGVSLDLLAPVLRGAAAAGATAALCGVLALGLHCVGPTSRLLAPALAATAVAVVLGWSAGQRRRRERAISTTRPR
ncbi:MAG TPA: lipopolysaccharide biosynthesis protein [Nocardioides sp.]|nr:lipopolysaccharide biosynthesis protein [Nocardioides sp.]